MGEGDLFKTVLEDLGLQLDFWRVKIRPGSPMSFGRCPWRGGAASRSSDFRATRPPRS